MFYLMLYLSLRYNLSSQQRRRVEGRVRGGDIKRGEGRVGWGEVG